MVDILRAETRAVSKDAGKRKHFAPLLTRVSAIEIESRRCLL